MKDILISGYYGFKNSGDDALLQAIVSDLKEYKEDVTLTVLSNSPEETEKIYKVRAVSRLNPISVLGAILKSKMLLSGGGTLIQDRTSTKSLIYYLAIIKLAHIFGKKVMLYSNGIGPLRDEHKKITGKILNKVDIITLRDKDSMNELEELAVTKPKIYLTADPAFSLEGDDKDNRVLSELGFSPEDKIACISVRNWKTLKDNFCDEVAKTADYLASELGYKILFMPMQPARDYELSKKIMLFMNEESKCIEGKISVDDTLAVMKNAKLCIGMRLHSLIYAASNGVPVTGLVYDPKIAGFMDYIGQPYYMDVEDVSFEKLKELTEKCIEDVCDIEENIVELKKKAKLNAELAIKLLEKGRKF